MNKIFFSILLLISCQLSAQNDFKPVTNSAEFTKKMTETSGKIQSIQSDFTQEKHLSVLEEKIISKGKFWFKKEDKIRMEYVSPTQYLMIMNNKAVRIKDATGEKKIATGANKLFQQISQITADCIRGNVLSNKDFDAKVLENKLQYRVDMIPNTKQMKTYFKSIQLIINKSDLDVTSIIMNDVSGDFTKLTFQNKKLNSAIPDEVFSVN